MHWNSLVSSRNAGSGVQARQYPLDDFKSERMLARHNYSQDFRCGVFPPDRPL